LKALTFFICSSVLAVANQTGLEGIRAEYHLPALTTGALKNGAVTMETVGVRKLGDPTLATDNDSWHLGSNSKAITATLGAILIERGVLTWNTTLGEVFPEWPVQSGYQHVTLRELFAHRSGIHSDITTFDGGNWWSKFLDPQTNQLALREEFTRAVLTSPPETDGSQFRYSNSGYIVAGQVMTKLTGLSWEALVIRNIFEPLKMSSCGFGAAGAESTERPTQPWPHHDFLGNTVPVSPATRQSDNPIALGPAGTIHCSIKDWLKFAQAHLDGFRGIDTLILSAAGFVNLHEDYKGQGYTSGGLIYEKRDGKVYLGHNGSNTMNFAILVLDTANNAAYAAASNRGLAAEKGVQAAMRAIGSPDICKGKICLLSK
jgi:CubicO group peptidase (beta-lactamase class C family)